MLKLLPNRIAFFIAVLCALVSATEPLHAELLCGAAAIDVTPRHLPVIRNGGFLQAEDDKIVDPLHARCIVFDDGKNRVAMVVVDSCMLPLSLCDEAKTLANKMTGIETDHIMISATHTHTAPSVMRFCLGSGIDERYRDFLPGKIAEAIKVASDRLQPAKVGSTRIDASHFTKCRRWITRTDKLQQDPFGELTIHANMHPGHLNPDYIGPSGPVDPWLSLLMVSDKKGKPIAALGNLSMHYYSGHAGVSADYCGRFANEMAKRLAADNPKFVGIMSQGTSGDLWWGDYSKTKEQKPFDNIEQFTTELADLAMKAVEQVEYTDEAPVRIAEKRLTMKRRVPNKKRLAWANRMNKLRGDRLPKDRPEVYALQAVYLHENPTDEVVLQAIRIGDLGITGLPNEVYGLTGLKLKRRSPLGTTFNVSLANGACGYIPPPEQHALGGYNTWPARTAGLEEAAEPKIVETLLELLEEVADKPREEYSEPATNFSRHIAESKPYAYWRLAEMEQIDGEDASGNGHAIRSSGNVAYHLPGRIGNGFGTTHDSHSVQLAGGKLVANELDLGESYSAQLSFYLGTPTNFRDSTGALLSRGDDQLIITGSANDKPGRIAFGDQVGSTTIEPQQWHQLVFVRNGDFVEVFLNGQATAELSSKVSRAKPSRTLMLGGDRDNTANFEGKFDEVSVYDRALTKDEVAAMFEAAGLSVDRPKSDKLKSEPLDAKTSMQQMHVRDGYRIELVAAEPMVVDPVAIDWGPDGKLWVAEMADYPMGMDGKGKPGGRIRFLEDTNNDGQYDRSTLFAGDIGFPNGILAWGKGVIVTAAPEIFYAEDTDGDGKADRHETLLAGFMTGNQQLRVNGLRWGLDGFVHCASGAHHVGFGSGNSIISTKLKKSISIGSRDFRFKPDTGELDPQSGPSQFGRVRDDFGNWFGVQNSQPLWHYVLADQYTRRNTRVASMDPRQQVRVPRMPEVYSAKPPQRRFHGFDHAGHYTSACGISIYRDELLFPREEMHAFTCEPFHNLVQHHVLKHDGTSFRGERANDGPIDFFASSDRWTRPVMTRTGPDGALWIVDMYRYMIEHPEWLPQEGKDALLAGYRAGDNLGRIYRVVPKDHQRRAVPNILSKTSDELIELFKHPNGAIRDLAHRELLSKVLKPQHTAQIRELVEDGALPETRLHAFLLLSTIDGISHEKIRVATRDESPAIRRHAIRIAEKLAIPDSEADKLSKCGVLTLVDDPDPKVRLQLAASLGEWSGDQAGAALAKLASRPDNDAFTNAAIISSLPQHYEVVSQRLLANATDVPDRILDTLLAMGEAHPSTLARSLQKLISAEGETRFTVIARWLDSMFERKQTFAKLARKHTELGSVAASFTDLLNTASELSSDSQEPADRRAAAIGLLGRDNSRNRRDLSTLGDLLSTDQPAQVQTAAMERLTRMPFPQVANTLISHWAHLLPAQRQRAANALLGRTNWTLKFLDAIKDGEIQRADLSVSQQHALRTSSNDQIAKRAKRVLGSTASNRSEVVQEYAAELIAGDATRGQAVFETNCIVCHTLDKSQTPVGPDLRALTNRSRDVLLSSILDPSQAVEPKYLNYSIVLRNGEVLAGVVTEEGEGSLTLVDATGKARTALRSSVQLVKRSSESMMPAGFEKKISSSEMSDLLAFLREL